MLLNWPNVSSSTVCRWRYCGLAWCLVCIKDKTFLKRSITICGNFMTYVIPFRAGDFGRFGTSEAYSEYSKFYALKLHQRCQVKPSGISSNAENRVFCYVYMQQCLFFGVADICETQQNTRCNGETATGAQAYEAWQSQMQGLVYVCSAIPPAQQSAYFRVLWWLPQNVLQREGKRYALLLFIPGIF